MNARIKILEDELVEVRRQSMIATRSDDFKKASRLSVKAANINRELQSLRDLEIDGPPPKRGHA